MHFEPLFGQQPSRQLEKYSRKLQFLRPGFPNRTPEGEILADS